MANPLDRVGAPSPLSATASPSPSPAAPVRPGRSFREVLGETAPAPEVAALPERLRALARSITSGERAVDRVIAQAAAGKDFSTPELIAIQARVYRYTQELELVSKLVDKACAGVKQTLQTQV